VLKSTGGLLLAGDSFKLFGAGAYSGSFTNVVSYTPGQTVTWDLTQLTVSGSVKVVSVAPASAVITPTMTGGQLTLSWPAAQVGWQLQEQTNSLATGLGTNWVPVAGSTGTNQVTVPASSNAGAMFFRLFLQN
jgi:hypothetical protein